MQLPKRPLALAPTALTATALAALTGTAASADPASPTQSLDRIEAYSNQGDRAQSQVNSVSQLRDFSPDAWAFEALRNLVETYGCIEGYPDQSFRGNRALTRYEFAAGLNACLQALKQQTVGEKDLQTLQRLVEEFEAELATLGTRVDNLEGRVATLEENQFSTTTKLSGEVVFALTDTFSNGSIAGTDIDGETVFQNRVRLLLESSFTGTDRLFTRIDFGGANNPFPSGVNQGLPTFTGSTDNEAILGWLAYYFSPTENSRVYLPAAGALHQDYAPTLSPYLEGVTGANNAISNFAESSPIYKINEFGGGVGVNYELAENLKLTAGYLGTADQFSAQPGNGLFNGGYSALGQIAYLGDRFKLGLTYVNAYVDDGSLFTINTGTRTADNVNAFLGGNAITNSFGIEGSLKLSDSVTLNAYGGFTKAEERGTPASTPEDAEIWYYSLGAAFPDLGGEGNLGGLVVGSEPYVGGVDDTALHIEAFYRYQLTERLSITPGLVWLGAPAGNSDDNAFLGTIRTTFQF